MNKNILQYVLWVTIILVVIYWVGGTDEATDEASVEQSAPQEPYWDKDLDVCNQAKSPVNDLHFSECMRLAESGRIYAQMRIAYLYFNSDQEGHLQESYQWMQKAGHVVEEPLLLSKIMLFTYGTTEEDKTQGYRGIVKLSDMGHSGASAYLAALYYLQQNIEQRMANPFWLLEKSFEAGDGYVSPLDLVTIYVNGFGIEEDIEQASTLLQQYAEADFPLSTNNAAWFMATTANLPFENSEKALELALSVVQDERFSDAYPYVDTLAAAYASAGDFDNAVKEQERAIALLKQVEDSEDAQQDLDSFMTRLSQFEAEQAAIYNDIKVDSDTFFEQLKQRIESGLLGSLKYATYQQ